MLNKYEIVSQDDQLLLMIKERKKERNDHLFEIGRYEVYMSIYNFL